jgi:hypothetical protein
MIEGKLMGLVIVAGALAGSVAGAFYLQKVVLEAFIKLVFHQ